MTSGDSVRHPVVPVSFAKGIAAPLGELKNVCLGRSLADLVVWERPARLLDVRGPPVGDRRAVPFGSRSDSFGGSPCFETGGILAPSDAGVNTTSRSVGEPSSVTNRSAVGCFDSWEEG